MLEVGGLLAVFELRPFLDQQLDQLRLLGEELQIGFDGPARAYERIVDAGDTFVDGRHQAFHDPIGGGEKQLPLGGEIAIDGSLADLEHVGDGLGGRIGVAVLGEELARRIEDFLAAAGANFPR